MMVLYPGSFDPLTYGHINIVERGLEVFDSVRVVVANNTTKQSVFSVEERIGILREAFQDEPRVSTDVLEGLLVEYAQEHGVTVVLKGVRTVSDFEFEFQMAQANRLMPPGVETVFMMTDAKYSHLSSSLIKEIIRLGGAGTNMIPPHVEKRLRHKFGMD